MIDVTAIPIKISANVIPAILFDLLFFIFNFIINWEIKSLIDKSRLELLNQHIIQHQPEEKEIYMEIKGTPCANLLSVINLQKLSIPIHVNNMIKISDSTPYKPRSQSGGWSYVNVLPDWIDKVNQSVMAEKYHEDLNESIEDSKNASKKERNERLKKAAKLPETIQIIQKGFRRNPDVIATVLERANGVCEHCNKDAPFISVSNHT